MPLDAAHHGAGNAGDPTRAAPGELLEIAATLDYQACDDKLCYRPMKIPLKWTVKLEPLAR